MFDEPGVQKHPLPKVSLCFLSDEDSLRFSKLGDHRQALPGFHFLNTRYMKYRSITEILGKDFLWTPAVLEIALQVYTINMMGTDAKSFLWQPA